MKKIKNKILISGAGIGLTLPLIALAQSLESAIARIDQLLRQLIPVLMVIATIVFLWGVITYITAAGDEDKIKKGRSYIIYGLLGLFVMVAVWGIVRILVQTFGVGGVGIPGGVGNI